MKVAGTDFTYAGKRYERGQVFDLGSVPAYLHGTLTRLYQLKEKRVEKPKPVSKFIVQEES